MLEVFLCQLILDFCRFLFPSFLEIKIYFFIFRVHIRKQLDVARNIIWRIRPLTHCNKLNKIFEPVVSCNFWQVIETMRTHISPNFYISDFVFSLYATSKPALLIRYESSWCYAKSVTEIIQNYFILIILKKNNNINKKIFLILLWNIENPLKSFCFILDFLTDVAPWVVALCVVESIFYASII